LIEEGFVIGFVSPAVLDVDFHLAGAVGLEEGEDVTLDGRELEFAFGEALLEEFGLESIVLASFARIVFEDGGWVGGEAVTGAVGGGVGSAFGSFWAGRLRCVLPVGIDLSLSRHSDPHTLFEIERGANERPSD